MIWFHDIIQGLIVDSSCHSPAILMSQLTLLIDSSNVPLMKPLPSLTISDLARGPPGAVFLPGKLIYLPDSVPLLAYGGIAVRLATPTPVLTPGRLPFIPTYPRTPLLLAKAKLIPLPISRVQSNPSFLPSLPTPLYDLPILVCRRILLRRVSGRKKTHFVWIGRRCIIWWTQARAGSY